MSRIRLWGTLLSGLLLSSPASAGWPSLSDPAPSAGGGGRDAALIIAIQDYAFVPDIPGARANGNAWLTWLTKSRGVKAENVRTLWDAQATAEVIERKAREAAGLVGSGGTLWFVFIGHGAPARGGDDGLLVGVDAQQSVQGIYDRSLAQKKLAKALAGRQKHTVLLVDACFSGKAGGGALAKGAMPVVPVRFPDSAVTVVTAGTSEQFAGALPDTERPAFSYLMLGALRGWGDGDKDGNVTVSEAVYYARTTLGAVVTDRTQTPEVFGPSSFVLASGAKEKGPDLAAQLAAKPGGAVKAGGFGRGLTGIGAVPEVSSLELAVPATSLGDVDTDLLDLVVLAQRAEAGGASYSDRASAWDRVAKYKSGGHELAAKAKARAAEWTQADRVAKLREAKLKQVSAQLSKDRAKLDKLLGYPDTLVSRTQKDAYTAEFERVYAPWRKELAKVGSVGSGSGGGWVRIAPGTFEMGSPSGEAGRYDDETRHTVRITRAFLLKATEVTQAEYQALMGSNPSGHTSCGGSCPVEKVSWFDAVKYANALSRKERLSECYVINGESVTFSGLGCRGYRLPTEAEWEYAARAGTSSALYGEVDKVAWYDRNSGSTPHPVAKKAANAWGLYDMLGNVWEWTQDWYASYPSGSSVDPIGPNTGSKRVVRGGSWSPGARYVRAAYRFRIAPGYRSVDLGFRLARSLDR